MFLRTITNNDRALLLDEATVLLYTPENEHFGIVPVEGMYNGCIVIACNSGGPTESILHSKTGFLLSPDKEEWGRCITLVMGKTNADREKIKEQSK